MNQHRKTLLVLAVISAFMATTVFLPKLTRAGDLEPPGSPEPTMHTMDEIYNKLEVLNRKLDFSMGMGFRFEDLHNGTVRDCFTGLIWLKNANCFGGMNCLDAEVAVANLADDPADIGDCGLSDGSVAGDWRLPTKGEWDALIDDNYSDPALSNQAGNAKWSEGDAFTGVQSSWYWSGTECTTDGFAVFDVDMTNGDWDCMDKSLPGDYVWPVRDDN